MIGQSRRFALVVAAVLMAGALTACAVAAETTAEALGAGSAEALMEAAGGLLDELVADITGEEVTAADAAGAAQDAVKIAEDAEEAQTAARAEDTATATAAAAETQRTSRKARFADKIGWFSGQVRDSFSKALNDKLRAAFRRAGCSYIHLSLRDHLRFTPDQMVAQFILISRHLTGPESTRELAGNEAAENVNELGDLDPNSADDENVMQYLADNTYCRNQGGDISYVGSHAGVTMRDVTPIYQSPYDGQPTGSYQLWTLIDIECTGDGPLVGTSTLWDYTPQGWVPDDSVMTGTDKPIEPACV